MSLWRVGPALLALLAFGPLAAATLRLSVQGPAGQPLPDTALMLEPLGGPRPAPRPLASADMGQQNKQFTPSVLLVPVGTRVDFPNRDTVRHHVYSFSDTKTFEIKLYVGRPAAPILFDKPGVVTLGCNIHDSMIGWIVVSDTPWYGKTAANGRLQLDDVPAGRYTLRTWHPSLPVGSPGLEQTVTVGSAALELQQRLPVVGGAR